MCIVQGEFKVGEWLVSPSLNQIGTNGNNTRVEPKAMQVLVYLAQHPGVVTKDQLISSVWPDVFVSDDVLPGCISALRKAFNDNARRPTVIETIHKSGYRLLLPVEPVNGLASAAIDKVAAHESAGSHRVWFVAAAIAVAALLLAAFTRLPSHRRYDSVAVLPFINATSDSSTQYLSDGIAEQVVDELSQLNSVRVMAWTTVSRYRQSQNDVRAIGRTLGVNAILTGTLARNGDQIALQTELVDVNNGSQLWGQRYDQSLSDISGLQHHLSQDIASNLRVKLTGDEQQKMQHPYQSSSAAYELYLKGRYFWGKRNKPGLEEAIRYFQQAIALDPNYALAYAGLADSYALLDDWGETAPRDSFPKARVAAERAIALDDSLAEAHVSLAMVRASYDWDWTGSIQEYKRAIALNPNYPTAHQWYGMTLASLGRFPEAEAEVARARELDPLSPIVNMAVGEVFAWEGKHDEAIAQYKRALELDPSFCGAYGNLAVSYERKQMYADALVTMKKKAVLQADTEFAEKMDRAYARGGYRAMLETDMKDELNEQSRKYVNPVGIAESYAELGDTDRALQWLQKGYEEHASGMQYLAVASGFDSIRTDPRFQYWLNVLNLPNWQLRASAKP